MDYIKKITFLSLTAGALFAGCSTVQNNESEPELPGSESAEHYITLNLSMPTSITSRADDIVEENGDSYDMGTEEESKFSSLTIYVFSEDGTGNPTGDCIAIESFPAKLFTDVNVENPDGSSFIQKTAQKRVDFSGEKLLAFGVVNSRLANINIGSSYNDFKTITFNDGIAATTNDAQGMLMTSRVPGKFSVTDNNTQKMPAQVTLEVERVAAKISYKSTGNNKFTVEKDRLTGETNCSVELVGYKIINLEEKSCISRKVGNWTQEKGLSMPTGFSENLISTTWPYVVDVAFDKKTILTEDQPSEYSAIAAEIYTNQTAFTALPTSNEWSLLRYCLENTMPQPFQFQGYATGLIFKALYQPKEVTQVSGSSSQDVAFANLTPDSENSFYLVDHGLWYFGKLSEIQAITNSTRVEKYEYDTTNKALECYYPYFIRHFDNKEPEKMGVMEFAVVRNNSYQLTVKTIGGIGNAKADINYWDPCEKTEIFLKVNLTIKPWVVRLNEIDL